MSVVVLNIVIIAYPGIFCMKNCVRKAFSQCVSFLSFFSVKRLHSFRLIQKMIFTAVLCVWKSAKIDLKMLYKNV